jgi:hypothetical protein
VDKLSGLYIDEILGDDLRPVSTFSKLDGVNQIDRLLERARHIPIWVISFGNTVASLSDLESKVTRLGRRISAIEIPYMHRPEVSSEEKKRSNREYLLVGVDPEAEIVCSSSIQTERKPVA